MSYSPSSLGGRLSKWLSLQVFLSFAIVSFVVFAVINGYLSARQSQGLDEKKIHIDHLFDEADIDGTAEELWHKLDDFLASHHELQIIITQRNGAPLYSGSDEFPDENTTSTKKLIFMTPAILGIVPEGVATLIYNKHADTELLKWLVVALVIASLLASFAIAKGAKWLVKREMQSVEKLVQQIHQIDANTLEFRLDGTHQPQELLPIVDQFNALLIRLNDSYLQLERFNADVAHELNTPLTTLITSCELELRGTSSDTRVSDILGSNLEELHRMSEIIRSMMFLSRAERGYTARCTIVPSVSEIVSEVSDYHEAMVSEAQLTISIVGDTSGEFDVPLLKRAISNLLANAVRYATALSTISVEISDVDSTYVDLTVVNKGVTIEPDAASRIFDRFYRTEASRSMADQHHGLGLSIVAAIAHMHGGTPHVASMNHETRVGFTMRKHDNDSAVSTEKSVAL